MTTTTVTQIAPPGTRPRRLTSGEIYDHPELYAALCKLASAYVRKGWASWEIPGLLMGACRSCEQRLSAPYARRIAAEARA